MFNALFVLIVFLLQLNKDQLHVDWPLGVKTNITYIEETSEVKAWLPAFPVCPARCAALGWAGWRVARTCLLLTSLFLSVSVLPVSFFLTWLSVFCRPLTPMAWLSRVQVPASAVFSFTSLRGYHPLRPQGHPKVKRRWY